MRRIIGEAEAGNHREFVLKMHTPPRARASRHVRSLLVVLVLAAAFYVAYTHRIELAAFF